MWRMRQAIGMLLGVVLAAACWADEAISLPAEALPAELPIVVWVDLEVLTPESLKSAQVALADTIIDDRERNAFMRRWDAAAAQYSKTRESARSAGARRVIMASQWESGRDSVVRAADAAAAPAEPPPTMVLVQTRPDADLEALTRAVRELAQLAGVEAGLKADAYRMRRLAQDWAWLEGPALLAPAQGEEADQAARKLLAALRLQEDAPIRVAVRMTEAQRQSLKEAMLAPGALLLAGVQQPLLSLDTVAVGAWAGQTPKIDVRMQFSDALSAGQFRAGLAQLVTAVSMMAQMAAWGENAAPDEKKGPSPQALRVMLSPLLMRQEGDVLTTTIGIDLLQRLRQLGVSWTESLANQAQPTPAGARP